MRNLGKGFSFGLRSFHRLAILNRPERQLDVSSEPAGTDEPGLIPLLAGFPLTSCGPRRTIFMSGRYRDSVLRDSVLVAM